MGETGEAPLRIVRAAVTVNEERRSAMVERVCRVLQGVNGRPLGVLGLAFKAGTDDLRDSPAVEIVSARVERGARVRAYDPVALPRVQGLFGEGVRPCQDPYEALTGADAGLILTDAREIAELDLFRTRKLMRQPLIIDGRNVFDPSVMAARGFTYHSVGRAPVRPAETAETAGRSGAPVG